MSTTLLLLFSALWLGIAVDGAKIEKDLPETSIDKFRFEFRDAMRMKDMKQLDRLLSYHFSARTCSGTLLNRKEMIQAIASHPSSATIDFNILSTLWIGNFAVRCRAETSLGQTTKTEDYILLVENGRLVIFMTESTNC